MNFQPTIIPDTADHLATSSIFSGIKKSVFSKDFKGGKVSNLFGSTEIDFTNADLNGTAILDISQAFGSTTITIPADWRVETDGSQFFAVIDDSRDHIYQTRSSDKTLVLKGLSMFASVEILNSL
jgi:hypothetical protein